MWKQWGLFCGEDELKETNSSLLLFSLFSSLDTVVCTQELGHMQPVLKLEIQQDQTQDVEFLHFCMTAFFFFLNITVLKMLVTNIYFLYVVVS